MRTLTVAITQAPHPRLVHSFVDPPRPRTHLPIHTIPTRRLAPGNAFGPHNGGYQSAADIALSYPLAPWVLVSLASRAEPLKRGPCQTVSGGGKRK